MNVLIVHAHPEPKSFTSALKNTAVEVLESAGHQVVVSDLYAQDFDPVARRSDFTSVLDPEHFRYNREGGAALTQATQNDRFAGFAPALAQEMQKLEAADQVIFTCPIWWYSVPAILKGWIDKVLALNFAYGHGAVYEKGLLSSKRAMLALTAGGQEAWYTETGMNGTVEANFYPVHHGVFWYCGMTVLEPFVAFNAGRSDDAQRAIFLETWKTRLETLDQSRVVYPNHR